MAGSTLRLCSSFSSSSSSNAPKRLKTVEDYVRTNTYKLWIDKMLQEKFDDVFFLIGPKGVGKTSLLRALSRAKDERDETQFKTTPTRYYAEASEPTEEEYENLCDRMKDGEKFFLLIDDIQQLPSSTNARVHLKFLLKQKKIFKNWFTLVASSRHGLKILAEESMVSKDEIGMCLYPVGPDKDVAEVLFNDRMSESNFPHIAEVKERLLPRVGFVPQMVLQCCRKLQDQERHNKWKDWQPDKVVDAVITSLKTFVKSVIESDQQHFVRSSQMDIYSKVLAILGAGNIVELNNYEMSPVDLPWTLLKATDDCTSEAVGPVSPMVQEIVKEHIVNDEEAFERNLQALYDITGGKAGNLTGGMMETLVRISLKRATELKYYYWADTCLYEGNFEIHPLNTVAEKENTSDVKSLVKEKIEHQTTDWTGHFPSGKDYDFVIFDREGKTHAIQVSKRKWQDKCRESQFYKADVYTYKYVLTTQSPDKDTVQNAMANNPNFETAMKKYGLRVIDPDFIIKSHFSLFRKFS